jgi:hypothetical protein
LSLADRKSERIERIGPYLSTLSETQIDRLVETGDVLSDDAFWPETKGEFGQFYAPFDWINESADIVLIGITPGKRQAKSALKALRSALMAGKSAEEAARIAKQAASFEGDMRDIAAQLMNRFDLHKLFRLADAAELFDSASHRAHYTSLLRYPVLHWQTKKKKDGTKTTGWFDYSGGDSAFATDMLLRSIAEDFEPEIVTFKDAWLVPFGPVPALALEKMADRGLVDPDRILPGVNHPSGTQWNRHNCQLNTSDDHSSCARNVGCETIRGRSERLEAIVAGRLAPFLA